MDIRDLRFFCLTAEMEHVTKAAEKLGVSQPFLTRVISKLEKEIDLSLFDNVGRKIRLNEYGENFYVYAKKVLLDMEELKVEVSAMKDKHNRNIKILCNMSSYSPELIVAFRKEYPNYTISIECETIKEIVNAIAAGDADYAFCSPPLTEDPIRGIKTELVFCEKACVLLPPGHPLIGKKQVTVDDIRNENLITTNKGTGIRLNIEQTLKNYDFRPQIVCESNDMNVIIQSVRNGMGYAIIPRWQVYSHPELKKYCAELDFSEAHAYIGISYNSNPNIGTAFQDFKDFAIKFLNEFRVKAAYGK